MPRGLQPKGLTKRNKMLLAAVKLFLLNGYEKTTTTAIAEEAGMPASSFFAVFASKEELLLTLVKQMFSNQFLATEGLLSQEGQDSLHTYAVETALQMYITELSEPLRELYVMAYTLPEIAEYIYRATAPKWQAVFADYLPGADLKDFYEMDIASSSIMRGFMAKPCDMYFTMERKLRRFYNCCFTIYKVPEEVQEEIIQKVLRMNLRPVAEKIIKDTVKSAEEGFEAAMQTEE